MYHCVLQVQSISLMSAASTAFILCIAMFVIKAFSLDCPYNIYIIISVIISVISAAVNISKSARKLFRNAWNLDLSSGLTEFHSFLSRIFFLFLYWTAKSHNVFRALIKLGLISNVSSDIGRICSCVVQFSKICFPNSSTGGSRLSRIFWEYENLSSLSVIWLIQLLLLKTNIWIKHCSTSKGSYWEDVVVWK